MKSKLELQGDTDNFFSHSDIVRLRMQGESFLDTQRARETWTTLILP